MDIRSAQKRAWQNKVARGFNITDIPLEFCLLQDETAEAFDAWRKGCDDFGEELADVAIYLLGLAEMTGAICRTRSRPRWPRTRRAPTSACRTASSLVVCKSVRLSLRAADGQRVPCRNAKSFGPSLTR